MFPISDHVMVKVRKMQLLNTDNTDVLFLFCLQNASYVTVCCISRFSVVSGDTKKSVEF